MIQEYKVQLLVEVCKTMRFPRPHFEGLVVGAHDFRYKIVLQYSHMNVGPGLALDPYFDAIGRCR